MENKISVIIPNYNGKDLLAKNLPKVISMCPGCQIIVVDDASQDGSQDFVKNKFKNITLVKMPKNVGFANAIAEGVKKAKHDLILLLNSDVAPQNNFLKPAVAHFNKSNSEKLFAVALCDQSHEDNKVITRGRGGASFEKGFVNHFPMPVQKGQTLWVSGGSGLFDKKKFLELGGFDNVFVPFYWEDIDLSFRAWRAGFTCIFEPASKVDHFHREGAILKQKSPFFIKTVSYKNQFIFVWKNISDYLLVAQHILWLPYHFTKALLTLDIAFFTGFLWAISYLPRLIFDYSLFTIHYSLSDKEVLSKFAKQ